MAEVITDSMVHLKVQILEMVVELAVTVEVLEDRA